MNFIFFRNFYIKAFLAFFFDLRSGHFYKSCATKFIVPTSGPPAEFWTLLQETYPHAAPVHPHAAPVHPHAAPVHPNAPTVHPHTTPVHPHADTVQPLQNIHTLIQYIHTPVHYIHTLPQYSTRCFSTSTRHSSTSTSRSSTSMRCCILLCKNSVHYTYPVHTDEALQFCHIYNKQQCCLLYIWQYVLLIDLGQAQGQ